MEEPTDGPSQHTCHQRPLQAASVHREHLQVRWEEKDIERGGTKEDGGGGGREREGGKKGIT